MRFVPLIVLLIWAAIEDVRRRRVPNWISFSLILSGLVMSMLPWRHLELSQSAGGLALGFGLGLILHLLRAVGAGDVKLLAGVGAWLGPWPTLVIFALAAMVGMVMAIIISARQGRLSSVVYDGVMLGTGLAQGSVGIISASGLPAESAVSPAEQNDNPGASASDATASVAPASDAASPRKTLRGLPFAVAIAGATIIVLASNSLYRMLQPR